jgi:tetratricopeptide (TPR) repeat protein
MRTPLRRWRERRSQRSHLHNLAAAWGLLLLVALALLAGCAMPGPTASSMRLPTRAPRTLTPTPTVTPTPFAITARAYYREGQARRAAGDIEGALQSFTWAIQRDPDFAPAYVARGAAYLTQGRLDLALADADAALEADPTAAAAHALRGEVLRQLGITELSQAAFEQAAELDANLQAETFRSRWLAAREDGQAIRMLTLSAEYADIHPDDPLRYYYRGWAYIELGHGLVAARILIKGIEATPDPSALLWFALGQAYATGGAWQEAVTALEVTRALVQTGDASLFLHTDQPIVALFSALGRAYLGAGRCADAETMLTYAVDVGALASEHADDLRRAHICQTPTPTLTPSPTLTPGVPGMQ